MVKSRLSESFFHSLVKETFACLPSVEISSLRVVTSKFCPSFIKVTVFEDKLNDFGIEYLKDFSSVSNSIYAGKKSELILSKDKSSKASNNARQMYNRTTKTRYRYYIIII